MSLFILVSKKGNAKECSNCHTIVLISHARKIMLKILLARLQQYMNWELPDVQAEFRKGRRTRDQIANICWIIVKSREFQKNISFYFMTTLKPLTVWITTNWRIFKDVRTTGPPYLLLQNLYTSQETAVRTRHGKMDCFKIGKGVH